MERREFCNLLLQSKEAAKVPLKEALSYAAKLTFKKIDDIESGLKDFNLSDALLYLKMCHNAFEFIGYDMLYVYTLEEIRDFFIAERKWREWTVVDVARHSHVSSKILYSFENGRCGLKIDTFLKLINTFEITLQID